MPDSPPTERALRLLGLLQARRTWPGSELAQRIGTDARTLRRDIERLRGLGYSIQTRRGPGGGYGLSTGSDLPPLVFTPDEALAVAAALTSSAASGAAGGTELALTALAKIEQVMPARVRRRMRALRSSTSSADSPNAAAGAYPAPIAADVLGVLALACRDSELVRLHYMHTAGTDAGRDSARRVEPVALVPRGTRWFLVCRDLDRGWRALRVDRITRATPTGTPFTARPVPGGDPTAFLSASSAPRPTPTRPRSSSTPRSSTCRPTWAASPRTSPPPLRPQASRAPTGASPTYDSRCSPPACCGSAGRSRCSTPPSSSRCCTSAVGRSPPPRGDLAHLGRSLPVGIPKATPLRLACGRGRPTRGA